MPRAHSLGGLAYLRGCGPKTHPYGQTRTAGRRWARSIRRHPFRPGDARRKELYGGLASTPIGCPVAELMLPRPDLDEPETACGQPPKEARNHPGRRTEEPT